jgi:hypothetical protein
VSRFSRSPPEHKLRGNRRRTPKEQTVACSNLSVDTTIARLVVPGTLPRHTQNEWFSLAPNGLLRHHSTKNCFFGQVRLRVGRCCCLQFGLSSTQPCVTRSSWASPPVSVSAEGHSASEIRILSSILKARQEERSWEAVEYRWLRMQQSLISGIQVRG